MELAAAQAGAVDAVGRPLEGVRVLAIEQMQALPYATQLLARLGADVVKIEPLTGDLGRASLPAMSDPDGRSVGDDIPPQQPQQTKHVRRPQACRRTSTRVGSGSAV